MALIYKVFFPSISTFETPPPELLKFRRYYRKAMMRSLRGSGTPDATITRLAVLLPVRAWNRSL